MSIPPQIPTYPIGTPKGNADTLADVKRAIQALQANQNYVASGSITGTQIGTGTIGSGNLATGSVTAGSIAAGTITAVQIAAGTITASLIAAGTIVAGNIAAGTITATLIAANTIVAGNIAAGTITATQIAAGTITSTVIAANTILAGNIVAGTITSAQIAATTITASNIAAATITATQIAAGTITGSNILAGTITASNIASATITASNIAAGTITVTQMAANSITSAQIVAGTIVASDIAATTITGSLIAASTITATNIATGTITGSLMAASTITSTNLASGSVTATQISVSSLSAVSSTMGTVTGGIFQTNTSGARVMMGSSMTTPSGITAGIVGIDTGNNVTFSVDAATGNVVLKGTILTGSTGLGNIGGTTQNAVLQISGTNLLSNPSLDGGDLTPFVGTNYTLTRDTATVLTGPGSLKAVTGTTALATAVFENTGGVSVPITGFTFYSFGVSVQAPLGATLTPGINFYNANGFLMQAVTGPAVVALGGQWQRLAADGFISPAANTNVLSAQGYPSFETSATLTTTGAGATCTQASGSLAYSGTYYASIKGPTAGGTIDAYNPSATGDAVAAPGQTWTGSVYVRTSTTIRSCYVALQWLNSSGTVLSTVNGTASNDSTVWGRRTVTAVAPASTAYVRIRTNWLSAAANEVHFLDAAQLAQAASVGYFENAALAQGTVGSSGHAASDAHYYDNAILVAQPSSSGGQIVAGSITATDIQAASITSVQIAANTITAGNIAAGAITATALAAGAVTATTIAAGAIDGKLITGATVQTATTDPRTALDSTGLWTTPSGSSSKSIQLNSTTGIRLTGGSGAINKIDWVGSLGASTVTTSISSAVGGGNGSVDQSNIVIQAFGDLGGATSASLYISSDPTTTANSQIWAQCVGTGTSTFTAFLLDPLGNSGFLQVDPSIHVLGGFSAAKSTTGTSTVTFTASGLSAGTTITLPGASGNVYGVGMSMSFYAMFILGVNNGNGTITFYGQLASGTTTGTHAISYVIWGS